MRQLLGVWAAGSLTLGTVALIFVLHRSGSYVLQPLASLGGAAVLVFLLVAALAVALLVLAARAESGLVEQVPGRIAWTAVVLFGGLAGWGYAAVVALALHWAPWLLAVLAYVGGGLPFTLVAAALSRDKRYAWPALGASVVLPVVGALLVTDGIVQSCVVALYLLVSDPAVPV